jgi:hypothetical protein
MTEDEMDRWARGEIAEAMSCAVLLVVVMVAYIVVICLEKP